MELTPPVPTKDNPTDCASRYSKSFSPLGLFSALPRFLGLDQLNLFFRKNCSSILHSDSNTGNLGMASPLGNHVLQILSLSSRPEMVRIYTSTIVAIRAIMQNVMSCWNRPYKNNERDNVTANGNVANVDSRISASVAPTGESPTLIKALTYNQSIEESFNDYRRKSLRGEVNRISIRLHRFLCRALGCFYNARAFSL